MASVHVLRRRTPQPDGRVDMRCHLPLPRQEGASRQVHRLAVRPVSLLPVSAPGALLVLLEPAWPVTAAGQVRPTGRQDVRQEDALNDERGPRGPLDGIRHPPPDDWIGNRLRCRRDGVNGGELVGYPSDLSHRMVQKVLRTAARKVVPRMSAMVMRQFVKCLLTGRLEPHAAPGRLPGVAEPTRRAYSC